MAEQPKSVLICGESGAGKSYCLRNIQNQEGVLYFNCEGGKPLPFRNKFKHITVNDPEEIFVYLQKVIDNPHKFHTIIIDTISFMMERFESVHVIGSQNTMAAWGDYAQFFKTLMYDYIAKLTCASIMLGHVEGILDEASGRWSYSVPVKGSLKKNGLEAYFTTVIGAKKLPIRDIEKDAKEGPCLTITERERERGYKHVFQTQTTRSTIGDRLRSPFGLFSDDETFIENDAQIILDRIHSYYADAA